jgi:hypothetical protein
MKLFQFFPNIMVGAGAQAGAAQKSTSSAKLIGAHVIYKKKFDAYRTYIGMLFNRRSQFLKVDNRYENLSCRRNPKTLLLKTFFKNCNRLLRK